MPNPRPGAKKSPVEPSAEVKKLAKSFRLINGNLVMPKEVFQAWRRTGRALPAGECEQRAHELLALAVRFRRRGERTTEALAQLCVLSADLMDRAKKSGDQFKQR